MNFTESENIIWESALKNTEKTAQQVARVYMQVSSEISKELEAFFKIADPSWSKQYQAERLKRIFEELTVRFEVLTGLERDIITKSYIKQYYDVYYNYAFSYSEFATGFNMLSQNQFLLLPFSIQPESVILASLNEKVGEFSFLRSTRSAQINLKNQLREAVAVSIQKGESVAQLSQRLRQEFNSGITRYVTTARTEMLKAFSIAQEESSIEAEDLGIDCTYVWKSAHDIRTRRGHAIADGQVAEIVKGRPRFKIQVWRTRNKAPVYMGDCQGPAPRLLTGRLQAEANINCRCRRITIPFKYNPDIKPPVINGIPDIKEYIKLLSNQ